MADVQVSCIVKPNRSSQHDGITHIGGLAGGGWKWTVKQAIDSINAATNTFHTMVNGKRAEIAVVNGPSGPYLRTHADGQWNDNLLALPGCP